MSFRVELSEQALADLQRMPLPVQRFVAQSLRRLQSNPQDESRPSSGLHARGFLFELEFALGNIDFYIDVVFEYGPAEDQLTVLQIPWEYV